MQSENDQVQEDKKEIVADVKNDLYVVVHGKSGLANSLYILASAIYFVEKYNAKLVLVRTPQLLWGTSLHKDRDQRIRDENDQPVPYEKTIFSKLEFVDKVPKGRVMQFYNRFGSKRIAWETQEYPILLINGYQQHSALFDIPSLPRYLNFENPVFTQRLIDGYGDEKDADFFKKCVVVCIRRGHDFRGKSKINNSSINLAKKTHFPDAHALVVSDLQTSVIPMTLNDQKELDFTYKCVTEKDLVQFALAGLCPNYILSESTFHVWMAYMAQSKFEQDAKIVFFNNTDLTSNHLFQPSWIKMDYLRK